MHEGAFKAQIKAAAYGMVMAVGADRAIDFLREIIAEIIKDNPGADWSGPGGR